MVNRVTLVLSQLLSLVFLLLLTTGCVGSVQWVERDGGTPLQKRWIPVCPSCREAVNFASLQCPNPECHLLLAWQDKVIYANQLYGEAGTLRSETDKTALPPIPKPVTTPIAPKQPSRQDDTGTPDSKALENKPAQPTVPDESLFEDEFIEHDEEPAPDTKTSTADKPKPPVTTPTTAPATNSDGKQQQPPQPVTEEPKPTLENKTDQSQSDNQKDEKAFLEDW